MLTFFLTFFSINLKHQSTKINYFLIKNKNNLILNLKKIMIFINLIFNNIL